MDGLWHERPAHEEDGDAGADDDEDATAHGSEAAEAEPADGAAEAEPEAELALLVDQYVAPVEVLARLAAHRAALLAGLDEAPPRAPPLVLRRGRTKRLFCRRDALATIRLWRVLAECATNLRAGRSATLRSVYYRLKGDGVVTSPAQVSAAVVDAVSLLSCPRACLGLTCASRGAVAGLVQLRDAGAPGWADLSHGGVRSVPGDLAWVERVGLRTDAAYVVVVEKDAVFHRLLQERLPQRLGCALLTARGQPDLASRALLRRLCALAPAAPVLGLVDYNPHGALILATYRGAARGLPQEAPRYGVDVRWLAARSADVAPLPPAATQPLTPRDGRLLDAMLRRADAAAAGGGGGAAARAGVAAELRAMRAASRKAELEALYGADGGDFAATVIRKALREDWV